MEPTSQGKCQVADNVELYYEVYGNGVEKVLLVMGLGTSGIAWRANVQWIIQHHSKYQICIFDNRGVGRSSTPTGRYTTSMMANDALKLVDFLGWDKFHLAGISMGGMISQEIALCALNRIKTLHLAVTHSGGPGSFPPLAGIMGVLKSNLGNKSLEERAPHVMGLMYPDEFLNSMSDDGVTSWRDVSIQRWIQMVKDLPPQNPASYRSQVMAVKTHSVTKPRLAQLRDSKIPILVCTGTQDNLVNPKASYFLNEQLKPVEFIVWNGTGHGVLVQQFAEYNQSLVRHWERWHSQSESSEQACTPITDVLQETLV